MPVNLDVISQTQVSPREVRTYKYLVFMGMKLVACHQAKTPLVTSSLKTNIYAGEYIILYSCLGCIFSLVVQKSIKI